MIHLVPFDDLGRMNVDWLNSRFHFNFSGVEAPMGYGFGPLRVWNDDEIAPHSGFPMHGHRDMEIITYVTKGAISHEDSLGNKGRTPAGDVQVMSAGTGIMHSEYNAEDELTHLFQIWIQPRQAKLKPRWDQAQFPKADRANKLVPLASGEEPVLSANPGTLLIHQDATLFGALIEKGQSATYEQKADRMAYLVVADGSVTVDGQQVATRAGAALVGDGKIEITATDGAEILLFDLPRPTGRPN
ncbi:pirin family protein [Ferrovibrio terrae]|uniref:pirin family protein n=1 Tax=Ferrovibrio terrae TaxID=2594003 RepID=UPI003137CD4B